MSANNWRECPQCKAADDKRRNEAIATARESYGVVSAEQYLRDIAEAEKPTLAEETLREDYELWIDATGEFYVSYRGSCDKCGLDFKFKHSEMVASASGV